MIGKEVGSEMRSMIGEILCSCGNPNQLWKPPEWIRVLSERAT
jgi:hypothetical protein